MGLCDLDEDMDRVFLPRVQAQDNRTCPATRGKLNNLIIDCSNKMASQDGTFTLHSILPSFFSLYVHRRTHTRVNHAFFLRHHVNCSTNAIRPFLGLWTRNVRCLLPGLLIHLPDGLYTGSQSFE